MLRMPMTLFMLQHSDERVGGINDKRSLEAAKSNAQLESRQATGNIVLLASKLL